MCKMKKPPGSEPLGCHAKSATHEKKPLGDEPSGHSTGDLDNTNGKRGVLSSPDIGFRHIVTLAPLHSFCF